MSQFKNIIHLPRLIIHILKSLLQQRTFVRRHIVKIIEKYDRSVLSQSDITKITKYYGNAVPAIIGECFCILRGKSITSNERHAISYLGAITGLYDDFFDKAEIGDNRIFELTFNTSNVIPNNVHEKIFIEFYSLILKYASLPIKVKEISKKVYNAQLESKLQKNSLIKGKKLKDIIYNKGGVSLLMYRSVFDYPLEKDEKNLLYALGSMVQLENDLFDIYKDYQDSISTLATTMTKVDDLRSIYSKLHNEIIQLLHKTNFPSKNKLYFIQFINLIISRGYVCLDFLEKNEQLTENTFLLSQYSRKDLVCDMEKVSNLFKSLKYYVRSRIV